MKTTAQQLSAGRDIVCVALPTWEGDYAKTIVQILTELAHTHRILYVDYAHTWKDVVSRSLARQWALVLRMLGLRERLRSVQTAGGRSVHVLTPPPVLPINWMNDSFFYRLFLFINGLLVRRSVRSAMRTLKFHEPIVINAFNPFLGVPLAGELDESLLLYYCYDEIGAAQWAGRHGQQLEREFIGMCDGVITSSQSLNDARATLHEHTHLVRNGVDFDLFTRGWNPGHFQRTTSKVIGYVGSLDDRLDYDLLETAIAQRPEYTFRFIGRSTSPVYPERLKQFPNVELYGSRPVRDLPALLQDFDLGIIPFIRNEFTRGIYPLKINEYLAAGIPVVMTDFAPLTEFESIVSIVSNADGFLSAIDAELAADTADKGAERRARAQANSWPRRAEELSTIMHTLLSNRTDGGREAILRS